MKAQNSRQKKYVTRGHPRNRPRKFVHHRGKIRIRHPESRNLFFRILGDVLIAILRFVRGQSRPSR
jgi:hypothetical protein